jgi:hypothetical protein
LIEKEKVGSVALKKRHKNVTFLSRLQRTYFLLLTAFTFMPYGNFGQQNAQFFHGIHLIDIKNV